LSSRPQFVARHQVVDQIREAGGRSDATAHVAGALLWLDDEREL
jgi:hypothetical protein